MTIRQATYDDLREIANVHAQCFPRHLSTRIGSSNDCYLLSRFYKEFLDDSPELFVVAADDNQKIVGFCMGYYFDKARQQSNYIRHNRARVYTRIAWLLFKGDRLAWAKLKLKFKKPHYEVIDHSIDAIPKNEKGDLLSICTLAEYRGKGYAQQMIEEYLLRMKQHGRKVCLLSLSIHNNRALRFYERNGFTPYRKIGTSSITYIKRL